MKNTLVTKPRTAPAPRVSPTPTLVNDPFAMPRGRRARRAESLASGLSGQPRRRTPSLKALVRAIRGDMPAADDHLP